MKKLLVAILILNIFLISALIADSDYFMITDIGTSAGMIRKGNIEGFSDYASIMFENPAGLYRTKAFSGSIFSTTFMEEVEYKNLCIAQRVPYGVIGLGLMTLGVEDIGITYINYDKGGEFDETGQFYSYQNNVAKLAYQVSQSDNFHFGASLSYYLTELYTYSGKGYNFDVGILIDTEPVGVSIVIKNLMTNLKVRYTNSEDDSYEALEDLPLQTVYSIKYNVGEFTVYGQMNTHGGNKKLTTSYALEYTPAFLPMISISVGYKEFLVINRVDNNQTLGVGLNLFGTNFDYAYEQSEHIQYNSKHYFSFGFGL
jgi:hypothetical protein